MTAATLEPSSASAVVAENTAEFTVRGIESSADVEAVESELAEPGGVMRTVTDADSGEAGTDSDHDPLSAERIEITVEKAGYGVVDGQ